MSEHLNTRHTASNRHWQLNNLLRAPNKTCFHVGSIGSKRRQPLALPLEGDTQTEFDLPGSTEGVDAGSRSHAIYIMSSASRAVDLPRGPVKSPFNAVPGKSKFAKFGRL